MNVGDKRRFNRPQRHAHQKGAPIVAQQKLTAEAARKRREWLRDHQEKLHQLLYGEWEK